MNRCVYLKDGRFFTCLRCASLNTNCLRCASLNTNLVAGGVERDGSACLRFDCQDCGAKRFDCQDCGAKTHLDVYRRAGKSELSVR